MKLISCHINNFGTLSDYSVSFNEGMTVIKEKNGFGKTTLAAFIRIMFYGMPRAGKTVKSNERQLYTPWQGGSYSGDLVFEAKGRKYKIERCFGNAPAQDTFKLFDLDTNKESKDFSKLVGNELFGLDTDSFERSTFMPQMFYETNMNTDNITARLSDLLDDTNDVNNFESAISALKKKRREYKYFSGRGGSIDETQELISKKEREMSNRDELEECLRQNTDDLNALENDIKYKSAEKDNISGRIENAMRAETKNTNIQKIKELTEEHRDIEKKINDIKSRYPKGIPSEEETEEYKEIAIKLDNIIYSVWGDNYTDTNKKNHICDSEGNSLNELEKLFALKPPSEEELEDSDAALAKAKELRAKNENIMENMQANTDKVSILPVVLLAAGAAVTAAGIFMLRQSGFAVPIIGVILFAAGIILYIINRKNKLGLNEEIQKSFKANKEEIARLESKAVELGNSYGLNGSAEDIMKELKAKVHSYISLKAKWDEYENTLSKMQALGYKYDIPQKHPYKDAIDKIKSDAKDIMDMDEKQKALSDKINKFRKEHTDISEETPFAKTEDAAGLKAREKELSEDIFSLHDKKRDLKQSIAELTAKIDELPQKEDELDRLRQQKEDDIHSCNILDKTIDMLKKAKDGLSNSYSKPLHDGFIKYAKELFSKDPGTVRITSDLDIFIEEAGQTREIAYFSAGYTDIIMLSMRLALIDALFKDESPFMILDDPFVNLDDEHTERALELLKRISEKKQVIYLVCSSSRCL